MDRRLLTLGCMIVILSASCLVKAEDELQLQAFGKPARDSNLFRFENAQGVLNSTAEDGFRLQALGNLAHDSNLFRFANTQETLNATGSTEMSDTTTYYGVSGQLQVPVSQQIFSVEVLAFNAQYNTFDFLDYTGGNARANWNLQLGRQWSGDIGYEYKRSLSTFSDQQLVARDIRDHKNAYVDLSYRFHPSWNLVMGVIDQKRDYILTQQEDLNREQNGGHLELRFFNKARSYVGLHARIINTTFPNRVFTGSSTLDNGYRDTRWGLKMWVKPRQNSRLEAKLQSIRREHDHQQLNAQDISSVLAASMDYDWLLSDKVSVNFAAWRDIDPWDDVEVDYILERGISGRAIYKMTYKVALHGEVSHKTRDFEGGSAARHDRVGMVRGSLSYEAADNLALVLSGEYERRESNSVNKEYAYRLVSAQIQYAF